MRLIFCCVLDVTSKLDLNLRKKLVKFYIWNIVCTVLKGGHFGNQIINMFEVVKRGAEEDQLD